MLIQVAASDRIGVDTYVFDALMPDLVGHDRRPAALLVYLYLWRKTRGGARSVVTSLSLMTDGTGLSKRSVQLSLRHLIRRGLVGVRRATATSATTVTLSCHWRS